MSFAGQWASFPILGVQAMKVLVLTLNYVVRESHLMLHVYWCPLRLAGLGHGAGGICPRYCVISAKSVWSCGWSIGGAGPVGACEWRNR